MNVVVHRVSPQQARYTPAGGREKCSFCRFFITPKWCGHVTGPVSPMGWCKYFSQEMRQQFGGSTVTTGIPAGATLSLDFMSSGNMPAGITFARASTATYTDAAGAIQTAAANQPRWDYANGVLRGLLIEEARTNLLLNSATLGTQGVAVTAQAYTLSFYGTGTVTKSGAATGALAGTGAGQRVTQTFTPSAGTVTCTVTGSVLNAQIEAGPFATSWISTAGATATRAVDVATMPTAAWFNASAGSICGEYLPYYPISSVSQGRIADLTDAGGTNELICYLNSTSNIAGYGVVGGVVQFNATLGTPLINGVAVHKIAGAYGGASPWRFASDGGAVSVGGGSAVPLPATLLLFGGDNAGTNRLNGAIRRVQYWPRALSDAEMQQVTT